MRSVKTGATMIALMTATAALTVAQSGGGTASVKGRVTDSISGAPIPRAQVALFGMANGRPDPHHATAGMDGAFTFDGLTPGSYSASAQRIGYVADASGRDGQVTLKEGSSNGSVTIRLTPAGAITGTVTKSDGEPLEGARVEVIGSRGGNNGTATSDKDGRFRIGGLTPGKYMVKASEVNMAMLSHPGRPEIRTDGTEEFHDGATYYPRAASEKEAGKVDVRAGSEVAGADIRMVRVPFVRVSGQVYGGPGDSERVDLEVKQGGGGRRFGVQRDGKFELWHLDPGAYVLSATWLAPNRENVKTVPVRIEVGATNVDGIALRVVGASDISGHLEFDSEQARKLPTERAGISDGQDKTVILTDLNTTEFDGVNPVEAGVDDQGVFQLKKVPAGKYRVRVSWGDAYARAMRLGPTVMDGDVLDLSNGSGGADLSVSMAEAVSSISGKVQNDAHEVGLFVALTGPLQNVTEVGADGTYSFAKLPPGKYGIVVGTGEIVFDDDSIVGYEDRMETVEVGAAEQVKKDLKRVAEAK